MASPPLLSSLAPTVAFLQSPDVEAVCKVNGLKDIGKLLEPWAEGGIERVQVRTPSQQTGQFIPSLPLRFVPLQTILKPRAPPAVQTELIVDSITALLSGENAAKWERELPGTQDDGSGLQPGEQPWYKAFSRRILRTRTISEHETWEFPICMLHITSTSSSNPLGALGQLYEQSSARTGQAATQLYGPRPYMDPQGVLNYFLLVHDLGKDVSDGGGGGIAEANSILQQINKSYGPHCSLLLLNSLSPALPSSPLLHDLYQSHADNDFTLSIDASNSATDEPEPQEESEITAATTSLKAQEEQDRDLSEKQNLLMGGRMTDVDISNIKIFLKELTGQSLVPWMEKCISQWNDVYIASRKGITGRLFGASRKFFGSSSKPPPNPLGYNSIKGYYPNQAPEAISRRLADFAFLLHDYKYAAAVYDSIRKDYAGDKAWRYQAAANEMFGLSILLSAPNTLTDVDPYLEHAVLSYRSRGIGLEAVRSTVLYFEAYKMVGSFKGAPAALIRAAGNVEEIPSAVLIEQAAYCDLELPIKNVRRYAFHLVMAAERYEKCGQKSYSRRCLEMALLIYQKQHWLRAEIHVEHALGRQAYTMGKSEKAVSHFVKLMRGDQGTFLDDFVLAYEHYIGQPEKSNTLQLALPQPVFNPKLTQIRATADNTILELTDTQDWQDLEQQFVDTGFKDSSSKAPSLPLLVNGPLTASIGETFIVDLFAENPINSSVTLTDLTIVLSSSLNPSEEVTFKVEKFSEVELEPQERRQISFEVVSSAHQTLTVTHAVFKFQNLLPCRQTLERRGKRLHTTKEQRLTPTYAIDKSLSIKIITPRPHLRVTYDSVPSILGQGETLVAQLQFTNTGLAPLKNLQLMTDYPSFLFPSDEEGSTLAVEELVYSPSQSPPSSFKIPNHIGTNTPFVIPIPNQTLAPSLSQSFKMICHGHLPGMHQIKLLLVYQGEDDHYYATPGLHSILVEPILSLSIFSQPSTSSPGTYLMDLELTNLQESDVRVTSVSALSSIWCISPTPLEIPFTSDLSPHSTSRTFVSVSEQLRDMSRLIDFTSKKLQSVLTGESIQDTLPEDLVVLQSSRRLDGNPTIDLASKALLPIILRGRQNNRRQELISQYPLITASKLPYIFPLFNVNDIDIVVFWEIPSTKRTGHLLLSGTNLGPRSSIIPVSFGKGASGVRAMFEETANIKAALLSSVVYGPDNVDEDPVQVTLSVERKIRHNFSEGSCTVPAMLALSNASPVDYCRVILKLQPNNQQQNNFHLPVASFTGLLISEFILSPSSNTHLQTFVTVPRSGSYQIANWETVLETGAVEDGVFVPKATFRALSNQRQLIEVADDIEVDQQADYSRPALVSVAK